MSEFEMIVKYLNRKGSVVDSVEYYNYNETITTADPTILLWEKFGLPEKTVYFFGNISIDATLGGVVLATDKNEFVIYTYNYLRSNDSNGVKFGLGVGDGLNLLGDGTYHGHKRLYGVGFNRMDILMSDFGAATYIVVVNFNGYLFKMK